MNGQRVPRGSFTTQPDPLSVDDAFDGARARGARRRRREDDDVGGVCGVGDVRVGAPRAGRAGGRGGENAWWISTIRAPGRENDDDDDGDDDAEDGGADDGMG